MRDTDGILHTVILTTWNPELILVAQSPFFLEGTNIYCPFAARNRAAEASACEATQPLSTALPSEMLSTPLV